MAFIYFYLAHCIR